MQGLTWTLCAGASVQSHCMMAIVHIDDAVAATVAALTAEPGVCNIVDDDPLPVAEWLPAFARWVDAPEPPRLSVDNAGDRRRGSRALPHESLGSRAGEGKAWIQPAPASVERQQDVDRRRLLSRVVTTSKG